jgi:hypothetical protein
MALVYNTVPNQSLVLLQVLVSIIQAIYSLSGLGFSKRAGNSAVNNHAKISNNANVDLTLFGTRKLKFAIRAIIRVSLIT